MDSAVDQTKSAVAKDTDTTNQENVKLKTAGIDLIWETALKKYESDNHITQKELVLAGDFGDADNGVKKATLLFETWRHPQDQKDKVITAVGGCLDWVDTAVGFISDHVDGTYATPAKIIAGAISKMIKAAKDMSEDFDLISKTFGEIYQAIKDIGLLQDRVKVEAGVEDHFVDRLTDIFVALFDFCSFGTRMFETSRRRRYIRALLKGRNEKIQEKCENVTGVILLFRATVPLKILREVEDIRKDLKDLGRDFPDTFIKALQDMRLKPSDLQLLTPKNSSLEKVKKTFGVKAAGMGLIETQMKLIESHYVAGTFEWLKKDSEYKTWFKAQTTPFLCVSGPAGTGKTYFTYHICATIQETMKSRRLTQDATKPKQNISVAYFFFDPGRPETQSLQSALSNIIVQIASQDAKFSDSIAKDLDKAGKVDPGKKDIAKTLWTSFLSGKLEKTADSTRLVYILLDGIDQLSEDDDLDLLHLFQGLSCDKTAIQVMMTGSPEKLQKMSLNPREINLLEKTRSEGDIRKIIDNRINKSENLKGFTPAGRKEILDHLDSHSEGVISFVDLTLSVMEQSADELTALKEMKNTYNPTLLYTSMIEIVLSKRSQNEIKSIETLFSWCTYAKDRLSVYEIQQIWELDPSLGEFDVRAEIQGKSKSMLYTTNRELPDEGSENVGSQAPDETETDVQPVSGATPVVAVTSESKLMESKLKIIEFRQPALKEHLESTINKLIGDPLKAKVQIFVRLCDILCDSAPSETGSRKALYRYATLYLVDHLLDIDAKETSPQQGRNIVEALSRVLTNENNVCSIFEEVMRGKSDYFLEFPLYDDYTISRRILAWAKKMSFHEDEYLMDYAEQWVETTIKEPKQIFQTLARGHIENLSKTFTIDTAWLPYKLAYRAFAKAEHPDVDYDILWGGKIDAKAARLMLDFSKDWLNENFINLARTRIALALLLNASKDSNDRKMALELYELNLEPDSDTPGPEKFYSYVGIAEYYAIPAENEDVQETSASATERWEAVLKNADLALQQRQDEKGALGSELDNNRCTRAFWLKAESQQKLGRDSAALETCKQALARNELEFTTGLLDFLTMIINVLSKESSDFKIMDEVQRSTFKMKVEWLLPRSGYPMDRKEKEALRKAAVMTRRVDFLIQLYEESIDYWHQKDWYGAQMLALELAVIYRRDARATKMAELTLENIMKEVLGNISRSDAVNVVRFMFSETVDILFENYTVTRSKAKKEAECEKLHRLKGDLGSTGIVEGIYMAEASLTLAKMLQGVGKLQQAKLEANAAFNLCINDLQDFVTFNDLSAFRMLSKTLMFAGLDLDAGIAFSLQYSDVDSKREDSNDYKKSETSSVAGGLDPAPEEENVALPAGGETAGTAPTETVESLTSNVESDKNTTLPGQNAVGEGVNGLANGNSLDAGPNPPLQLQGETSDPNQGGPVTSFFDLINGDEKQRAERNGTRIEDPKSNSKDDPKVEDLREGSQKNPLEDLIPEFSQGITCNGLCSLPPIRRKDGLTTYLCLDCHDVDFCSDCKAKQVSFYTDMGEGFWFKICWAHHQYIEQPIKDWHGVKDGIIRIGAKQKPYKLWLQAVKEKWSRKLASMT